MKKLALLTALLALPLTLIAQTPGTVTKGPGNIGGMLYASNFGQWQVPKGNNGQFSWSSPQFCSATASGLALNPVFSTNAPIIINDQVPANSETVTPSTVRVANFGCSITVSPVNQHSSFTLASGTAGLQEAINYAAGLPYTVVLTPDWSRLGGQTSMILAAKGNSNVSILDQRTACMVGYTWSGSAYVAQSGDTCSGGGGLSGMTATQVPIAATASTVASSKALAGAGTGITTGPTTSTNTDCVQFTGTGGQIADSGSPCSSGSGTLPFPGIVYGTSSSTGTVATYQQLASSLTNSTTFNTLLSTTNPTAPGNDNVLLGYGVAPNLSSGTGGNVVGGQHNVFIGNLAGAAATTQRESVVIGDQACANITGNNAGPDDSIMVCLGSLAGANLTNNAGADVIIGQKAEIQATTAFNDVIIGTHTGIGLVTSNLNTMVGAGIMNLVSPITGSISGNSFFGAQIANGATGDFLNNNCFGLLACTNLTTGVGNIVNGYNQGTTITSGSYNIIEGATTGGTPTGAITGNNNILFGSFGGAINLPLSSGANNLMIQNGAGGNLTTGSNNILVGVSAAGNLLSTGINNIVIGGGAGLNMTAAVGHALIIGESAGIGVTAGANGSAPIIFGQNAGAAVGGVYDINIGDTSTGTTSGSYDVAVGGVTTAGTTGNYDLALGHGAKACTTASSCIALGANANAGTIGGQNVVIIPGGSGNALTTGASDTFAGYGSSIPITTGQNNAFYGAFSAGAAGAGLSSSTCTGYAACYDAIANNTTAYGYQAGKVATVAVDAFGYNSLVLVTTGTGNAGFGINSCNLLTTETNDTCLAQNAEIAATFTGSTEIGAGTLSVSNALGFRGNQIADSSGNLYSSGAKVALSIPTGTATFTAGTNVTSCGCAAGYLCNNTRGTLTIVGGTATTGTICTVNFSAALAAAPACFASMNGGATFFGIGNSAPTTSLFNITSAVSVAASTATVNYTCQP